jgi:pimeloyl-ACP methyl ester carboxylesterase
MLAVVAITLAAAAGAVVALGLVWAVQERVLFQPSGPPWPAGDGARRVDYRADDGAPLFAYVVDEARGTAPAAARGALVAFHGNADLAGWLVPWARELSRRTGRLVVLAEYRGYAGLPGPPRVEGVRRDARAALRLTTETLGVPPARVALYGHSLGSAVATELAAEAGASTLLLESPFTSARAMARLAARPIAAAWPLVGRIPYDTEARVRALDAPVWVAHGERDVIVPVAMGRAVHAAARRPGELLLVPDAGHNDVWDVAGERYWAWVERALGAADPPRAAPAVTTPP